MNNNNICIGLITIGNGDWKKVITNIWNSLEIDEDAYRKQRALDEYNYKLKMDNIETPALMTNYDLRLKDGYMFNLVINTPVMNDCEINDKMVLFSWWESEMDYRTGSKMCCEKLITSEWTYNTIILCGDNLTDEEMEIREDIAKLCSKNGKCFWEIGNNCECMNIGNIIKWLNSKENYSGYNDKSIVNIGGSLIQDKVIG